MKKFLITLMSMGFVTGAMAVSLNEVMRQGQCVFAPETYRCSNEDKKRMLEWFIDAQPNSVLTAMGAGGIRIARGQEQKIKEIQEQKKQEIAAIEQTLSSKPANERKKEAINKLVAEGKFLNLQNQLRTAGKS